MEYSILAGDHGVPTDKSSPQFEKWLDRHFGILPPSIREAAKTKWRAIRTWHRAERHVWYALRDWSTMRTADGRERALQRLGMAYEERNVLYQEAERKHFTCGHSLLGFNLKRTGFSKEVLGLLHKHPGMFPPRQ